jgi:NAD(P)-dependent dehydrogenase (short-subunit alcohol dehydrogenase family)
MVAAVVGRFGKLDILINNAAQDSDIAADAMRLWHELNETGRVMGGVQGDCVMNLKLRGKARLGSWSAHGF